MIFDDWNTHKKETLSKTLFWDYDMLSPDWNTERMKNVIVQRVLETGVESDYYAIFQLYGGQGAVIEIIKNMPYLGDYEINWVCALFGLKREELHCYKRSKTRRDFLNSLPLPLVTSDDKAARSE